MDSVIKLISREPVQREDGTWADAPEGREVFCKVQTVSRREFFDGGRAGLNPAYRFDVFAEEYRGEELVEYNGETWTVYRTYRTDANTYVGENLRARQELLTDYIQLYAEKRGGAIGIQTDSDAH